MININIMKTQTNPHKTRNKNEHLNPIKLKVRRKQNTLTIKQRSSTNNIETIESREREKLKKP